MNPAEYPAQTQAKAPISPATGLRPALLKARAASGGITRIAMSLIRCAWQATNATT